ncbi:MAG: sigma-70 family RNA polymerase sigma factor [Planctomycetes bacterium]|nr:sigma-70 family RNA polymerase sigma factor [Planctomycetota bacterium]
MTYTTHTSLLTRLAEEVNPKAWREFHDRYADLIRGFTYRYGLQPMDGDDIVQEVLFTLSKAMNRFKYDPQKGRFRSYLKTLTLHKIFQLFRQKDGKTLLMDMDVPESGAKTNPEVEAIWEEEWRQYHVRHAMARLESEFSEKDRIAFSHYAVKGYPAAETAADLGISLDQVYQAKSRILKRLSEMIDEQVRDEG